jgi:Uma2 family endonuclease
MFLPVQVDTQFYTVSAFEAFVALPENRNRCFELIDGTIVEKMPSQQRGQIALRLGSKMLAYVEQHYLGRVAVAVRHRLPGDEYNLRQPDVAFSTDGMPNVEWGSLLRLPDLVVEIKSRGESYRSLHDKAAYYLANGTEMVWLIYPEKHLIEVQTPDDTVYLNDSDSVNGGDVLPGFCLSLREIFA